MKAYSMDLRLKVLEAVDRGVPRKEVARVFGISVPSIKRWLKRRRESGDVEPSPIPGPPARKGALLEGSLCRARARGRARPDAKRALRGVREGFGSRGIDGHDELAD